MNALKALFQRLFGKTINGIVADIDTKISQLHIVADAHALEAKVHAEVVVIKQKAHEFAVAEEARARSIASKFQALLS